MVMVMGMAVKQVARVIGWLPSWIPTIPSCMDPSSVLPFSCYYVLHELVYNPYRMCYHINCHYSLAWLTWTIYGSEIYSTIVIYSTS